MSNLPRCDCLNDCGDDPGLLTGKARPCAARRKWLNRPVAVQLDRVAKSDCKVIVTFQRPLDDGEFKQLSWKIEDIF